VSSFLSAHQHN